MDKKQWGDKFETFMIDEHAKQYHGLDDEMPDDYEEWIQRLEHDEIVEFIGKFCLLISKPKKGIFLISKITTDPDKVGWSNLTHVANMTNITMLNPEITDKLKHLID